MRAGRNRLLLFLASPGTIPLRIQIHELDDVPQRNRLPSQYEFVTILVIYIFQRHDSAGRTNDDGSGVQNIDRVVVGQSSTERPKGLVMQSIQKVPWRHTLIIAIQLGPENIIRPPSPPSTDTSSNPAESPHSSRSSAPYCCSSENYFPSRRRASGNELP